MLWIVGLIVGAFVGSLGGAHGALVGAVAGALLGYAAGKQARNAGAERWAALEENIERLRLRLDDIEQRLDRSSAAPPSTPASVSTVMAAPACAPAVEQSAPLPSAPTQASEPLPAHEPVQAPWRPVESSAASSLRSTGIVPEPYVREAAGASERTPAAAAPAGKRFAFWSWVTGGNPFLRVGVVVLFFGVAFLLRYAAEHVRFPIEWRLATVALGAFALLGIGWWLRRRRAAYALILQGTAVGILFLTVFAAYRLYALLPAAPAFALLVMLAGFCAVLAVAQDSRALAVAGISGGFLAPILASTGAGSHVALFGYYLVLDAGILAVAWFKAWRVLNVVGFAFTFFIGSFWGAWFYRPELFASTAPFLAAFFLLYVAIALLFARRQALELRSPVDGTIVFGTPLVVFLLQTRLVDHIELGAAYSAVGASGFYLLLAAVLARRSQGLRLLKESFLALGIAFATLAIPLAFDARVSAASWALEGAAIVWVSVRQRRGAGQIFGVLLQFAAGAAFLYGGWPQAADLPVLNSAVLGAAMVALGGLYCAWLLERTAADQRDWRFGAAAVLFCWGVAYWCAAGWIDIERFLAASLQSHAMLLFLAATCVSLSVLHRVLAWEQARFAAYAWLPFMVVFAFADAGESRHPFAHGGFVAWPLAGLAHFVLLRRHEDAGMPAHAYHAVGLWLLTALAAWELAFVIDEAVPGRAVWAAIGGVLVPAAVLGVVATCAERVRWPLAKHRDAYLRLGGAPIAFAVFAWGLAINVLSSGDPTPLPYAPLLNPLDLAQVAAFCAVAAWVRALRRLALAPAWSASGRLAPWAAVAGFVWLNGVLLRTLHHWAGVRFDIEAMLESMLVQASLSIFWTVLALCTMLVATRRSLRTLWLAGAALMGVVTFKLFFVDLSNVGGIERVVSFLAVGLLLLLIGYFSPAPPKRAP